MVKRLPWIDIGAAAPVAAMALFAPDLIVSFSKLDPLFIFRFMLLLWVLVHVVLNVARLVEGLVGVRQFLRSLEQTNPRMKGVAATGDRVFIWSVARALRFTLRFGWPTLGLAAIVVTINAMTWLLLAGWRPDFLKPIL